MQSPLIASITGWAGTILSEFFYLSPYSMFKELTVNKQWEKIPYIMLLCSLINSGLYVIYGTSGGGTQVWFCNILGHIFSLVFIIWFLQYRFEDYNTRTISCVVILICSFGFLILAIKCAVTKDEVFRSSVNSTIGGIALIVNILLFIAPAQNIVSI
jgi:hypothetical protein